MKLGYFLLTLLLSYSLSTRAQRENAADSITHVEVYGETGKGDTAIISFKNGERKKVYLPNEKAREKFHKQYKNFLGHHHAPSKEIESAPHVNNNRDHEITVPNEIVEYIHNPDRITLKLKNGAKEVYDLKDPVQKKTFMDKYNNFLKL